MWVVLIRVNEQAKWCGHGPFADFNAARQYVHNFAGTNMERHIIKLLKPWEAEKRA